MLLQIAKKRSKKMKKIALLLVIALPVAGLVFGQGFGFDGFGDGGFPGGGGIPGGGSNKAMDKANDAQDKMEGRIPMRFFDAVSRQPIPSATVEIPNVGSLTTNNQGKIAFPRIPDGNYTLTFRKSGYVTTPIEFRVVLGAVDFNWYNIPKEIPLPPPPPPPPPSPVPPPLPPVISTNYRIVLEWGERPADLDVHFVKTGGSGNYHISYLETRRAEDGNAVLDRDDTAGYGPETVTIGRIETNATYTCYIHDYTNGSNPESAQMSQNGATVRVYSNNRLVNTFTIPTGSRGTRWNVFKIERGVLSGINTVVAR
jgi:hypothetical protein